MTMASSKILNTAQRISLERNTVQKNTVKKESLADFI